MIGGSEVLSLICQHQAVLAAKISTHARFVADFALCGAMYGRVRGRLGGWAGPRARWSMRDLDSKDGR